MTPTPIAEAISRLSLERMLTAPQVLGLPASAHQRLACRAIQGGKLPHVAPMSRWGPEVEERTGSRYMLGPVEHLEQPRVVYLIVGVRTGKSLIAALSAIKAGLSCDLSGLRHTNEAVRVSVLSLRKDLAQVIREHIDGIIERSPLLQQLVIPGATDADRISLMHPTGRRIEIMVVAGARTGAAVVSRWSAGVIVDEAPRFAGANDAKVNFEDLMSASLTRLVPGAQFLAIGSPWAAYGPVYDAVQKYWRRPADGTLVIRSAAPPWFMGWWTPQLIDEIRESPQGPVSYKADVLGEFVELATDALSAADIEACRGHEQMLPFNPTLVHVAGMDPGMRRNAWTLVIARWAEVTLPEPDDKGKPVKAAQLEVVLVRQWLPPPDGALDPEGVLAEMAPLLASYGVSTVYTDQHCAVPIRTLAQQRGLMAAQVDLTQDEKIQLIGELSAKLALRRAWLPDDAQLCDDLKRVRRIATSGTRGLRIELPQTGDGRHCDYVPALMLAMKHLQPPIPQKPDDYDPELEKLIAKHKRMGKNTVDRRVRWQR
jgi:hypothetical protein